MAALTFNAASLTSRVADRQHCGHGNHLREAEQMPPCGKVTGQLLEVASVAAADEATTMKAAANAKLCFMMHTLPGGSPLALSIEHGVRTEHVQ